MASLLEAALQYQRRGWSVIPVNGQSKKPLIKWEEYTKRRATGMEIGRWWKRWPDANIGIVTGRVSNLVVVDADEKAKHLIHLLPDTPIKSKTGSGWFHYYYRYPPNTDHVANVARKDGFDVRADGGYVVAPPSTHASGNRYAWVSNGKRRDMPVVPSVAFRKPSVLADSTNGASTNGNGHGEADKNWLSRIMQGVGHGERNDSATRLAGYYFGKHMPFDVVLSNLELWNARNDPPLSETELVSTVRSVFGKEGRKPPPQNGAVRREQQRQEDGVEDPFALVNLTEYMTKFGGTEATWMVEGWMPDSTIALAVAPPGSYKTWLELDMAVSVATGFPFLGHFEVKRPGPVIIVQQEDFHGQMAERMATIIQARVEDVVIPSLKDDIFRATLPPAPPIYLHPDRRLRFSDDVVLEALEKKVAQIRPRLVIIDPLYSTGSTDDYLAATVNQMFALKTMRDRYGCSFLLAHHTAKNKEGTDREASWGSQFVNAFLETGWQIRRKGDRGQIIVRRHFKVSPDIDEVVVTMDISTSPPYRYHVDVREANTGDRQREDSGNAILEVFTQGGAFTPQEIAQRSGIHRTTAFRKLEKLITAEVLKKTIGGKYALIDDMTV